MAPAPVIRLHPDDGVLIARSSLPPGMVVADGVTTVERIPAGHKAVGCIQPTLLDEKLYPGARTFDPDRWLDASERQQKGWVPHGGGVHTEGHRCAGEQLATLMLKVMAVKLLRRFDWSVEGQDLAPTQGKLFATPKSGLWVELKPAA